MSVATDASSRVDQPPSRPSPDSDSEELKNPNKDRLSKLTAPAIRSRCALIVALQSSESSPDEGETVQLTSQNPLFAEMEKQLLQNIWAAKAEEEQQRAQAEAEEESSMDKLLKVSVH